MIDYATYCRIQDAHQKHGLTAVQIARELKMDVRTIARWLAEPRFRQRQAAPRPSKLDDYKGQIVRLLQAHDYSATQIFQQLREAGYAGGVSIVKQYVREVRRPRRPAFLTLSFPPGDCARVDWGEFGSIAIGNTRRRLSFFAMVLCHSRMLYVQFTPAQTMEQFLDCHVNAFSYFGAAAKRVMVDNLKSAVLRRITGEGPVFNPRYKDFADHYGLEVTACTAGQPQQKGRVENAVSYIKKNFLAGREITSLDLLNLAARQWLDAIANVRLHGATNQRPVDLFAAEKPSLRPLPVVPYDVAVIRPARANSQFRVVVDTNSYSVPAEHAGAAVTLKLYPQHVCIYRDDKLIARHVRHWDQRLLALTPRAEAFYQAMSDRQLNVIHHVRKIVALAEIYGNEPAARAIEDALEFGALGCEYIANILEQRKRLLPEPGALHLTRRQDLLELDLPAPDIALYDSTPDTAAPPGPESIASPQPPAQADAPA